MSCQINLYSSSDILMLVTELSAEKIWLLYVTEWLHHQRVHGIYIRQSNSIIKLQLSAKLILNRTQGVGYMKVEGGTNNWLTLLFQKFSEYFFHPWCIGSFPHFQFQRVCLSFFVAVNQHASVISLIRRKHLFDAAANIQLNWRAILCVSESHRQVVIQHPYGKAC